MINVPGYIAQDIVESMKDIINQDINYFDNKGIIIASTDKERIGNFHGGAKKILDLKTDLIIMFDGQFEGAKKGINVPIYFDKEIVGVIGITGEKEEVEKYGRIIKRMTEILIKESYIKEQESMKRESERQFIEELLFRYYSDEKSILARADLLNIKIDANRVVVVARLLEKDEDNMVLNSTSTEDIFNLFKSHIEHNKQNLLVQSGMNIILIYELKPREKMEGLLQRVKDYIESKHSIRIFFGIGNSCEHISQLKKSYRQAKKALDISIAIRNKEIVQYESLDIGLLLDEIPLDIMNKYVHRVFKDMDKVQINEYSTIVDSYIKHNGSITKASEELFLHKNTLQYRLNKLAEITGYNPRKLDDMVVIYLAFTLFRLEFDK